MVNYHNCSKPKHKKNNMEIQSETSQVPEKYVQRDTENLHLESEFLTMDIPVIDLALLETLSNSGEEFGNLRSALSTCGCFQVINHGMSPEFLDNLREVAKQFFELPVEKKQKYSTEEANFQGYTNMAILELQEIGKSEKLYLDIYPEDRRNLKLWPEKPEVFRSILDEYSTKLKQVNEKVFKAMARSLNLQENCFLEQYGEGSRVSVKFGLYPRFRGPDLVLGQEAHTDGSAITLVLQDKEIEGLQFLKDNQWFRAPIIPEALLINVGDQAEISSNGIFKSSIHRVVTNPKRERVSLVAFYLPEIEREIKPFENLIGESSPAAYRMIKNYPQIYLKYRQQGKRPIEAAKIDT